jgi:predicted metal-dependent HD superfamily phosphohydrolase
MNLDAAKSYALDFLINHIGPEFHYHNLNHTLDVFQAVSILAINEKVSEKNLILLQTAALYHDLGIYINYDSHEEESIKIIENILPGLNFSHSDISIISKLISGTNIYAVPYSKMGELLCDADLDYLGRNDYLTISNGLRKEWKTMGIKRVSDKEWYQFQIKFLENHHYFSSTANLTRNKGKINNLKKVAGLLESL